MALHEAESVGTSLEILVVRYNQNSVQGFGLIFLICPLKWLAESLTMLSIFQSILILAVVLQPSPWLPLLGQITTWLSLLGHYLDIPEVFLCHHGRNEVTP